MVVIFQVTKDYRFYPEKIGGINFYRWVVSVNTGIKREDEKTGKYPTGSIPVPGLQTCLKT